MKRLKKGKSPVARFKVGLAFYTAEEWEILKRVPIDGEARSRFAAYLLEAESE